MWLSVQNERTSHANILSSTVQNLVKGDRCHVKILEWFCQCVSLRITFIVVLDACQRQCSLSYPYVFQLCLQAQIFEVTDLWCFTMPCTQMILWFMYSQNHPFQQRSLSIKNIISSVCPCQILCGCVGQEKQAGLAQEWCWWRLTMVRGWES